MLFLDSNDYSLALEAPLPLTVHPAAVYLRSLGSGSRSTMEQSLKAIASLLTDGTCDALTLDWSKLRYRHTSAVQAALLERYQPATAKKMMSALRRVLKEARKLGLMDELSYTAAIELPSISESGKLRGRALSAQEIGALVEICQDDPTPQGVRDAALIGILRGAGLRRAEVVKLEVRDWKLDRDALEVRGGKGGKDRTVYLPSEASVYLENWLKLRGRKPGALLCPIRKGGGDSGAGYDPPSGAVNPAETGPSCWGRIL